MGVTALGRFNTGLGSATTWVATDPLFEVGNGSSTTARSNALTVLKNGNTSISGSLSTGGTLIAPSISTTGTLTASSISTTNLSAATITSNGQAVITPANLATSITALPQVNLSGGIKSTTSWSDGFAFGPATVANVWGSTAIGYNTKAEAAGSLASGWHSRALGATSVAFGHGSTSHGYESLSMGRVTNAYGNLNFVGGWHSNAHNYNAFVYGHHCHANSQRPGSGNDSDAFAIAMGSLSGANSNHTLALGYGAASNAPHSMAIGRSLGANTMYETNMGVWANFSNSNSNWSETDALYRLGNGTGDHLRSEAITVLKNGQTTLTNKAWKANPNVAPSTDNSNAQALVVDGHAVMNGKTTLRGDTTLQGKVTLTAPQGDISMGIYQ